jgi:hypothetical protein
LPNARSEAVGSRPNSIGLGRGPPQLDDLNLEECRLSAQIHESRSIQRLLAQANGHIAELKVQMVRQRAIVKYALDTGQQSEMAESMLLALEESLGPFEKHRELVLDQFKRPPSE